MRLVRVVGIQITKLMGMNCCSSETSLKYVMSNMMKVNLDAQGDRKMEDLSFSDNDKK